MATQTTRATGASTTKKTRSSKTKAASAEKTQQRPRTPAQPMYNDGMLNIAMQAAVEAGKIQLRAFGQNGQYLVSNKSVGDFVTDIDRECEQAIKQTLTKAFPDHAFLGEEGGLTGNQDAEYVWIIDPLDGTTNYIHGIGQFAVSIACRKAGQLIHAVVYDPCRNELFSATKGKGAHKDQQRIRVSGQTQFENALIGTGLPFRVDDDYDAYLPVLKEVMQKTAGVRRPGAAALDLCWVACGRYDAFWERGVKAWDIAAGALIASEAGALVTDFAGESNYLETGEIVVGSPRVFVPLMAIISKHSKK